MYDIKNIIKDQNFEDNLLACIIKCNKIVLESSISKIEKKSDGSLVTSIDKEIDISIKKKLALLYPHIPIISEEGIFDNKSFTQDIYWLIDPIDGTSGFVKGENGYTINIALIFKGTPILGYIANPPTGTIWYGFEKKAFVYKNKKKIKIQTDSKRTRNFRVILSKSFDKNANIFVKKIKNAEVKFFSSSIKFCIIAEGKANIYPRLQSISKWDIAAGDAILRAAGGILVDADGKNFKYNTLSEKTGAFFALSSKFIWKSTIYNILEN